MLMRDVYHCDPLTFDLIPQAVVDLHREFIILEARKDNLDSHREDQRAKMIAAMNSKKISQTP